MKILQILNSKNLLYWLGTLVVFLMFYLYILKLYNVIDNRDSIINQLEVTNNILNQKLNNTIIMCKDRLLYYDLNTTISAYSVKDNNEINTTIGSHSISF